MYNDRIVFSTSDNEPGESLINKFLKKKSDRSVDDEVREKVLEIKTSNYHLWCLA